MIFDCEFELCVVYIFNLYFVEFSKGDIHLMIQVMSIVYNLLVLTIVDRNSVHLGDHQK